ncbi:MAG: ABC transporter ATP-binding protein [Proteobacteria bacterium]|nr:ABC transporter ATP-binding protein [Pseudomonadota bacterium]
MTAPILEVRGLTKKFGGLTALDDVHFEVYPGEIVALIGPNGAGKTTLLRHLMGVLKPTEGKVVYKGHDITGRRPWDIVSRGLVGTFQVVKPFRNLPCVMNVVVASLVSRKKRGEWTKRMEIRARDALEFVGIADLALERAAVLSHGDLKRLEIAKAIATEPELMLLDEPFGGLNPAETELIANSIRRLHKGGRFGRLHSEEMSMVIVEHKLADLMRIVDRVVVLNFGRVLTTGTPEEVVNDPRVIEAYIGKEVVFHAS